MKIVKIILILLLAELSLLKAAGQGVDYFNNGDIYGALKLAQQKKQLLIVEFHAPWNYRSHWQNIALNQNEELYKYINANFVTYKFDTQTSLGANFANQYNVTDYPKILVFNANGDVINQINKAYDPKELIKKLQHIQFSTKGSEMWKIYQIETQLDKQNINKAQELSEQLVRQIDTQIINQPYWEIIENIELNYYLSDIYILLRDNQIKANEVFTVKVMNELFYEIINKEVVSMLANPSSLDSIKTQNIVHDAKQLGIFSHELELKIEMISDFHNGRITDYINKCEQLCDILNEDQIFNITLTLSSISSRATPQELHLARKVVTRQMRQTYIPSQINSLTTLIKVLGE